MDAAPSADEDTTEGAVIEDQSCKTTQLYPQGEGDVHHVRVMSETSGSVVEAKAMELKLESRPNSGVGSVGYLAKVVATLQVRTDSGWITAPGLPSWSAKDIRQETLLVALPRGMGVPVGMEARIHVNITTSGSCGLDFLLDGRNRLPSAITTTSKMVEHKGVEAELTHSIPTAGKETRLDSIVHRNTRGTYKKGSEVRVFLQTLKAGASILSESSWTQRGPNLAPSQIIGDDSKGASNRFALNARIPADVTARVVTAVKTGNRDVVDSVVYFLPPR